MIWLLSCSIWSRSVNTDTAVDVLVRPDDWDSDSTDSGAPLLEDIDQDGFSSDVDCDDWDPNIYPGAPEIWNYEDDDCDGFEDIDGHHQGEVRLLASAIFEGETYGYDQQCSADLSRIEGELLLQLSCVIDPTQPRASLLLGGTIVATGEDSFARDEEWSGDLQFVSTGGEMEWDSVGEAQLRWSPLSSGGDEVVLSGGLNAVFLNVSLNGTLYRVQ